MAGDSLYTSTSFSKVAAIDPLSGQTKWTYDPATYEAGSPPGMGFVHRGVALWEHGADRRILIATGDAYLIALDAMTGTLVRGFGDLGRIDLTKGLRRPVDRLVYVRRVWRTCSAAVETSSAIIRVPRFLCASKQFSNRPSHSVISAPPVPCRRTAPPSHGVG
jgi:glucose dehydrogenase